MTIGTQLSPGYAAAESASLGLRLLAGAVDFCLLAVAVAIPASAISLGTGVTLDQYQPWVWLTAHALMVLYYCVAETKWGTSAGKALCSLHVVNSESGSRRALRFSLRALVFVGVTHACEQVPFDGLNLSEAALEWVTSMGFLLPLLLLFSTCRKTNGYAAVHDLLSHTRVLRRKPVAAFRTNEQPPAALNT